MNSKYILLHRMSLPMTAVPTPPSSLLKGRKQGQKKVYKIKSDQPADQIGSFPCNFKVKLNPWSP